MLVLTRHKHMQFRAGDAVSKSFTHVKSVCNQWILIRRTVKGGGGARPAPRIDALCRPLEALQCDHLRFALGLFGASNR